MNKIGLNLARMAWPIDPYGRQQTHSETCYTSHVGCAVHRLVDQLEQLHNAAMDVCNNARESDEPDRYSVSVTLIHNLQFLLTGM
jgi:hypothetical protein